MAVAAVGFSLLAGQAGWSQSAASTSGGAVNDRERMVISKSLPKMNGDRLKAVLLEVRYAPGEASPPHSHPCAVIGYVMEGSIRSQVKGEPEAIYNAGQSFYEAPNGVHLVSANASSTNPATLLAYMLCDGDAPLSVDVPANQHSQGNSR
jgi:quercetin dioxygenase-like cupin family protein